MLGLARASTNEFTFNVTPPHRPVFRRALLLPGELAGCARKSLGSTVASMLVCELEGVKFRIPHDELHSNRLPRERAQVAVALPADLLTHRVAIDDVAFLRLAVRGPNFHLDGAPRSGVHIQFQAVCRQR